MKIDLSHFITKWKITAPIAMMVLAIGLIMPAIAPLSAQGVAAPAGSYRQTCHGIAFSGTTLSATCDAPPPSAAIGAIRAVLNATLQLGIDTSAFSKLDVSLCRAGSDIWNGSNGLYCYGKPDHYQGHAVPFGSYVNSCKYMQAWSGQLDAWCANTNGDVKHITLDLGLCDPAKSIDNVDAQLVCSPKIGSSSQAIKSTVDPLAGQKFNAKTTTGAGAAWQNLVLAVYSPKCSDAMCLADIATLALQMRNDAVALQASQPNESSLAIQGTINKTYGKKFEQAVSNSTIRVNPNVSVDTFLHATKCSNFLGRPNQYLCETPVGYNVCKANYASGVTKACYSPGLPPVKAGS